MYTGDTGLEKQAGPCTVSPSGIRRFQLVQSPRKAQVVLSPPAPSAYANEASGPWSPLGSGEKAETPGLLWKWIEN